MQLRCFLVVLFVFLGAVCTPLFAQTETATLSGYITDPSGAAIAGAEVQIINVETKVSQTTRSNQGGLYLFPSLPPGQYRMSVKSTGFKEFVRQGLVLHVQDTVSQNFKMELGSVSESITVSGGTPLVNTESGAVSTVVDRQFVDKLPLNGRSFNTLLQLTPGVVIAPANNASNPGQFSIAGQRTDANNFTVDGVSANFGVISGFSPAQSGTGTAQAFSAIGGTSSLVSVEALQEFRIQTSSFAPEFGRTPGGQVILSTKAGTNNFHGGIYEYFRNDVMDANDWFANAAGKDRAPERHNNFGGFLGGPILKNKTFFFLSYEGARLRLPQAQVNQVPSASARASVPATLAPFLKAYPQPDANGPISSNPNTAQFTGVWSNSATLNAGSARIDHVFNDRFSVFGRYNDAPSQLTQRVGNLSTIQFADVNTRTVTAGLNMLLSTRLSNTVRGNYSTQDSGLTRAQDSFGGAVPLDPALLLGSLPAATNNLLFQIRGVSAFLATGANSRNRAKQWNFLDDLSLVAGTHQLKFGGDYRALLLNTAPPNYSITATAASVQSFLASGRVSLSASIFRPAKLLTQSLSLYGQDTWKISPRFSLTYGLRWELSPAPSARGTTVLVSWTNVGNPAEIALAPSGTPVWSTTYGNFAPRIGVAYSLTQKGDFVLRAGGGLFYDLGVGKSANLSVSFPNFAFRSFPNVGVPISDPTPFLPALTSPAPPFPSGISGFAPDLVLPRSYQWNVALEKSFGGRQTISATYLGQAGRNLLRQDAFFQPNSSFAGEFLLTGNGAWSNYDALQLQYRLSISARLHALFNYNWSHSLDNASNDVALGLSNIVISAANDYASSDFDVRQSLSGALTYELPSPAKSGLFSFLTRDWSMATVVVARSGFPFNALLSSISADPGGFVTTRPDTVSGQPLWIANQSAPGGKSLNPAAFVIPSTVRQGTEGRNDISGFGLTQIDLSIGRKFALTERLNLQFRTDAFNVLNHPNFTNPAGFIDAGPTFLRSQKMLNFGLGGLNPLFQEGGPRSLQLSLKLSF